MHIYFFSKSFFNVNNLIVRSNAVLKDSLKYIYFICRRKQQQSSSEITMERSMLKCLIGFNGWGRFFKKIDNTLSHQQFKIDANRPGVVVCYRTNNGNPDLKNVFKVKDPKTYLTTTKPEVIIPEGCTCTDQQEAKE